MPMTIFEIVVSAAFLACFAFAGWASGGWVQGLSAF